MLDDKLLVSVEVSDAVVDEDIEGDGQSGRLD